MQQKLARKECTGRELFPARNAKTKFVLVSLSLEKRNNPTVRNIPQILFIVYSGDEERPTVRLGGTEQEHGGKSQNP